jgi:membrane-associated phospholipid phosphatase
MTLSMHIGKQGVSDTGLRRVLGNLGLWFALTLRPRRIPAARLVPLTARLALATLAGVALVTVAMLALDFRAMMFARTLPLWVVDTFNEITDFGQGGWFLIPIGVFIVLAAILTTQAAGRIGNLVIVSLIVRLEFIFLAVALPGLTVTIVKRLIGRVRPSDLGPFAYMPWSWQPAYASMPSGHATTAYAAAIAIGAVWRRARVPMWIFAGIIALSRVVITAHYVSDVVAAAFVGAFGAILVRNWFAARRLGFVAEPDGAVHPLPGPSWRRLKAVARRLIGP